MFVSLHTSKTQCIIYRPDFYRPQKSEMVETVQIKFSINSNTTRSQI